MQNMYLKMRETIRMSMVMSMVMSVVMSVVVLKQKLLLLMPVEILLLN